MANIINASTSSGLTFSSDLTGNTQFQTNGTNTLFIDTNGNLGVGVTPSSTGGGKAIELGGTALNTISFLNSGNIQGWITSNAYYNGTNWLFKYGSGATATAYATNVNGQHQWLVSPSGSAGGTISWTQAMTLDNSGNLFVGSTSDPASGKFAIRAANNINLSMGASTGSISGALCFNFINNTNGANVPFEIRCLPGNFYITNGLNSGSGSTMVFNTSTGLVSYSTSSLRYKENVQDIKYGLADVLKMRAVNFDHISDKVADIGVIAEEMINVIPEVVGKNKDGLADYVNYDKLTAVLIKSIQELSAEVTALKAKVGI